jgi:hypothetical protein
MTKFELLSDCQAETLAGGWAFPSLTSKTSSMEINNLISQSNVGSAWASTASVGGAGGGGGHRFPMPTQGTGAESEATNIQKNILNLTNFGFSFAI